jgi:P27 family predicted phage terminase small subunit
LLREIQGNPGKRPINKREPQPGELGEPSPDLCEVARAKWAELARLEVWGLVATAADAELLAEYCRLHARKAHAEAQLEAEGSIVISPKGYQMQSPWLQIINRCRTDMLKIALEFGGSPSSRTRLSVSVQGKSESKWDGLIAG